MYQVLDLIKTNRLEIEVVVDIKPLSANQLWQGRRFKTQAYKQYEKRLTELLPDNLYVPDNGKLIVWYTFGFSSKMSDYDNAIKGFQDVLQKKYNFDDNRIYEAHIFKEVVKKGEEYIIDGRTPESAGMCSNAFCALSNATFIMMATEKMPGEKAIKAVNEGKFDKEIKEEKTELSAEELKKLEIERKKLAKEIEKRRAEYEKLAKDIINKMAGKDR